MAQKLPAVQDLFSNIDETNAKALSIAKDEFDAEIRKSFSNPINTDGKPSRVAQLQEMVLDKSLSPDALASLQTALEAEQTIQKDWAIASPLSSGLAIYDLETPAKLIFPKMTPFRNTVARERGYGKSHMAKVITGITGSNTGGNGNIHPGFNESTVNPVGHSGSISLNRPKNITHTAADLNFQYSTFGLSDSVTWDAQDTAINFDDLRTLATQSTLYALMLMEERMMLMGRGATSKGYLGALAAPTITLTPRTAGTGETAIGSTLTLSVYATADAGEFGESVLSASATTAALTVGQVVDVTVTVPSTGALGYKIYAGTGAANPANEFYQGRTSTYIYTIQGPLATTTTAAATINTSGDTSSYLDGYDGVLPILLAGANNSFIGSNSLAGLFNTTNPGNEFQSIFASIMDSVKGDPTEIRMNGYDRKQLTDAFKTGGTNSNYRMAVQQNELGKFVGGLVIDQMLNEVTGTPVDVIFQPWLTQGVAPVLSRRLPIPDSNVDEIWKAVNVREYTGTNWSVIQRSYDNSVDFRGTFACYAPNWNGVLSGIKKA